MSESDFAGRHVLITGGTRGIGKALAVMLAGEGAKLSLNYVSRAEDAAAAVGERVWRSSAWTCVPSGRLMPSATGRP